MSSLRKTFPSTLARSRGTAFLAPIPGT
jgi:hypothetical protein